MKFTLAQIAELIAGRVDEDKKNITVSAFGKIESASAGEITFFANPKYEPYVYTTQASAIIVSDNFTPKQAVSAAMIRVPDAYAAMAQLMQAYQKLTFADRVGVHKKAVIDTAYKIPKSAYVGAFSVIEKGVRLGEGVRIYPQCYIGEDVYIGAHTIIYAGVRIYAGTHIGSHVIIHSGAVIGADGFGFAPQADGSYEKIPQIGRVIIGDKVEIGANTAVDRATMGETKIGEGVKLDNLVQIGHNVHIGKHTVLAGQAGVAGSALIGERTVIAGQVGITGHLRVGDQVQIGPQSGVMQSIADKAKVWGSPTMDGREFLRSALVFRKLPELEKRLRALEENK